MTRREREAIPIPPLQEQAVVVGRAADVFSRVDTFESQIAPLTSATERATTAIAAKAFGGELLFDGNTNGSAGIR